MTYFTLDLKIESSMATVSLNRPDARNAMNETMMEDLKSCFNLLSTLDEVRLVILEGIGPSFSAGADLQMMKDSGGQTREQNIVGTRLLSEMYQSIDHCSKPILGVVHGHAFGGGFGLCCVCDIVIAEEKTIFSLSEVLIGLIPAVIAPYAENKIGKSWFRALGISGERFNATFAEKIGLIHYSVKENEIAMMTDHIIKQVLKGGPISQAKFKEYLRNMPSEDSANVIAEIRASEEGQEGLSAFLEKRKPNWIKD